MKSGIRTFFILGLGLALTGCSMDASILNMDEAVKISFEKPTGAEFVSASTGEYMSTPTRHYKVQAVAGHFIGTPVQETPNRKYLVYSSVQGSMLSEEEAQIAGASQ